MKNDLLLIGGTHGNERIGVEVLQTLEKRITGFDWIIGNPPAFEQGTRIFEGDLNRSAPGDTNATTYAKRRAAELIELSQGYRYTIDLHGTDAYTGIFVIVTKPTPDNIHLALRTGIPRVVIWPSFSPELAGPISEFVPCGVEIECGPQNMPLVREKLAYLLETFVTNLRSNATIDLKARRAQTTFYEVYGSLKNQELTQDLQEFTEITIEGETFSPLLVGRYQERNGITCYKMRRM